jgi:hypothetical protein
MEKEKNSCCEPSTKKSDGLKEGIVYAIIPHTFCILFIVFSLIGSVAGMVFIKGFLANRNFFLIIFIASLVFAGLSSFLYLKRKNEDSLEGIKNNWKYLSILFGTIIAVNFLFFFYVFPAMANINSGSVDEASLNKMNFVELSIDIPCPGHAPLITDELRKNSGVMFVEYDNPNIFKVYYDPSLVSENEITSLSIFNNFKAKVLWPQEK